MVKSSAVRGIVALSSTLTIEPTQFFILGILMGVLLIAAILMIRHYLQVTRQLAQMERKRGNFKMHFYQFLDLFPVGILGLGPGGEILLCNFPVKTLTGAEIHGLKHLRELNCFSEAQLEWLIYQIQQPGTSKELSVQIKAPLGSKTLLLTVSVPQERDLELPAAYLMIQDQTREKAMSAAIAQQDKADKMHRLSAGVVHELKSPLVSIKGYVQMLGQRLEDPDFVKLAMSVLPSEIDRMLEMVEGMLKYARFSSREKVRLDLKSLVEDVIRFFKIELTSKRIQLQLNAQEAEVISDAVGLRQVLINILINAIEAMPGGGTIEIELDRMGDVYLMKITDQGIGMTPGQMDRLLESYYTTKENGSGMGIPVSHQIMLELGGRLLFESTPGDGTTVTLEIPIGLSEETVS